MSPHVKPSSLGPWTLKPSSPRGSFVQPRIETETPNLRSDGIHTEVFWLGSCESQHSQHNLQQLGEPERQRSERCGSCATALPAPVGAAKFTCDLFQQPRGIFELFAVQVEMCSCFQKLKAALNLTHLKASTLLRSLA